MPNLAFQIEVLKQVITERAAGGDATAISLSQNNFNNSLMQFAVLGAMGPDMLRYMPISATLATFLSGLVPSATSGTAMTTAQTAAAVNSAQNALAELTATGATPAQLALGFELYFNPLGAAYSVLFGALVIPVWPIFSQITDVFNQLDTIVQTQNKIGLVGMISTVEGLQGLQSSLAGLPATIAVLQSVVGAIVTMGPWMEMNQTFPPPAEVIVDRRHEFLRWHHTGTFAQKLRANAFSNTGSPNQQAYVFGWLCHISSSVTAEPFVNNIVGGPYRTHWWRNRLAGNFVDSWTFGFFEQAPVPTMAGDNPTPAYCDPQTGAGWPSICNANLQNLFNVANLAGPSTPGGVPDAVTAMASGNIATLLSSFPFPAEISNLLTVTLNATYPAAEQPIVGLDASGNQIPAFGASTFASAYIGAFAVYWFMTGGGGIVGNNPTGIPTGQPEPSWVSSGSTPSPQQAGLSVGGAICAVILAIAAIFLTLTGNFVAGMAALLAAINAPIIDWSQVANELFWLRKTVVDQENALRDALVYSALAYPPPVLLGMIDPDGNTLPATDLTEGQSLPATNVPATQGVPLCKTNVMSQPDNDRKLNLYPHGLDTTSSASPTADLNWVTYPTLIPGETPATDNLIPAGEYPNSLIVSNGAVANGGIMAAAAFPTAVVLFGDAVANAVQLITDQAKGLPDYNLDADCGYGWQTWDPQTGSNPFNPPVAAVQEP
jgi:hypothetical protein